MMTTKKVRSNERVVHWTALSEEDFQFAVAQDFVTEVEQVMDARGVSQKKLASLLKITEGRVSQVINNPGNLTLGLMIRWAGVLGMKLGVVAYDDGDRDNSKGPIYSGVFRECWEALGKPSDRWELDQGLLRLKVPTRVPVHGQGRWDVDLVPPSSWLEKSANDNSEKLAA